MKRFLSLILALVLLFGCLGVGAFAADDSASTDDDTAIPAPTANDKFAVYDEMGDFVTYATTAAEVKEAVTGAGFTVELLKDLNTKSSSTPYLHLLYPNTTLDLKGHVFNITNTTRRIVETRTEDILPGDVLYVLDDFGKPETLSAWVFNGSVFNALVNGKIQKKGSYEMVKMHMYDFFLLLRPGQVG